VQDKALFTHLAAASKVTPPGDYSAQGVANTVQAAPPRAHRPSVRYPE
jgi:hypothetical protein